MDLKIWITGKPDLPMQQEDWLLIPAYYNK
jgi:hypothetical protein